MFSPGSQLLLKFAHTCNMFQLLFSNYTSIFYPTYINIHKNAMSCWSLFLTSKSQKNGWKNGML